MAQILRPFPEVAAPTGGSDPLVAFVDAMKAAPARLALEIGGAPDHIHLLAGMDLARYSIINRDVDLPDEWSGRFDAVIAVAVFEHIKRPWIAAGDVARVMARGAHCYIATSQSFADDGRPVDFFVQLSAGALRILFADAGLEVLSTGYKYGRKSPYRTLPPFEVVDLLAVKRG
jgi:hypothetical protein